MPNLTHIRERVIYNTHYFKMLRKCQKFREFETQRSQFVHYFGSRQSNLSLNPHFFFFFSICKMELRLCAGWNEKKPAKCQPNTNHGTQSSQKNQLCSAHYLKLWLLFFYVLEIEKCFLLDTHMIIFQERLLKNCDVDKGISFFLFLIPLKTPFQLDYFGGYSIGQISGFLIVSLSSSPLFAK